MLKHSSVENVHYWQVGRSYFGKSLYLTGFFFLEDTLIDSGPPNALPMLRPVFLDLPVRKLLITHHHEDHTGNVEYLQRTKSVPVYAYGNASELLADVHRTIPLYRRIVWGRPKCAEMERMDTHYQAGKYELEVIPTPGHSEDHVCFYVPEKRWLFTGDLFLSTYLRYLRQDENIYEIMTSLQTLIHLRPEMVFCNHRGFVASGEQLLSKKLSFLESIRDQVLDAVRKGIPVKSISGTILKKDYWFRGFSAGEFSSENLVRAFVEQEDSTVMDKPV